jgi:mono/diheme cytochrome c family protein/roadblock/LC7 domain-containing protein
LRFERFDDPAWSVPMRLLRRVALAAGLFALAGPTVTAQDAAKKDKIPDKISYYKDVRPLFQQHCQGCHQPAQAKGGYIMTDFAELLKKSDGGEVGVVPGSSAKSAVYRQIIPQNGKPPAMPRGKEPLSPHDVTVIKRWIEQGAVDDTPASAKLLAVDADHPPVYELPPVVDGLAFSPDGQLLAVTGYHEVLLHKADGTGLVARLVGISERVQSVAFSPDGKTLAVTGGNPGRFGEVQLWDVAKRRLRLSLPVTFDTVYGASWSPDGKLVAFGGADNSLRAIDAEAGTQVLYQGGHSDWVLETVFSVKGTYLISVSRDRSMKLTEVATQRLEDNITSITPGALKGGLQTVDRHPQKDELLIGGADGTPKLYQMFRTKPRQIGDDFNLIRAFAAPMPGRIFAGRFSPDGSRAIVGSSSDGRGEARVYEVATGKLLATLAGIRGPIYAVAHHPKEKLVASAGFDGTVYLHNPDNGQLIREFVPVPVGPGKKS